MSVKIEHPPRELVILLALSALILWVFYLRTLSPAFPPDDSPETITAAFSLGIQHPPGYPLAALFGRCAIVAVPLGSAAFRVNLLSAALACAAAALAGWLAFALSSGDRRYRLAGAWAACLGLGALGIYWEQATAAKGGIYLLNLALGFGAWLAALRGSRRAAWVWSGLAGLMLANHYPSAMLWLLPSGAWLFVWQRAERKALLAMLPGFSLYLYLPLRAMHGPVLNWGDPSTWSQFWWVIGRGGYTQAQIADHAATAREQLGAWISALKQAGWWWLPALAFVGGAALWRERRKELVLLLSALALSLFAALAVNKTTPENRWLCLIFALPGTALLAPLAGAGLANLLGVWKKPALASVAIFLGTWALTTQNAKADRSGSYVAWDYARDLSLSWPKGALYLAEGDYHLLPVLHRQVVEGKRTDVLCVLNVLAGEPWYQDVLHKRAPGLKLPGPGPAQNAAVELVRLNVRERVMSLSPFSALLSAESMGLPLHQRGLPRALGAATAEPDYAAAWAARPPRRSAADLEKVEADLLPWYTVALVQTGNEALGAGRAALAAASYQRALERPGPKPEAPLAFNLGLAHEGLGRPDLAKLDYQRSLRVDPSFAPAQQRLQALLAQK